MRVMRRVLGPTLLAAVTIVLGLPSYTWPANTLDEMILLVYPMRMLSGDLPYRDFFAAYGPAHWWFLELMYAATSPTIAVERGLGLLVHVAIVLGTYAVCRRAGRTVATTCGVLAALLLFRLGDAPYAWLICVALVLWQVALLMSPRPARPAVVLAGLLSGLAISVRPDVALLAVLPAVPLLKGLRQGRSWVGGLSLGLLPLIAGLVLTPSALVNDILHGRAGRGAGQSRLPLPPADRGDTVFLSVLLLTVLLSLLAALRTRQNHLLSLGLLGICALPQALQRADTVHFVYAGLLCLPLLPLVLGELCAGVSAAFGRPRVLGALGATAVFLLGTGSGVVQPVLLTFAGDGPEAVIVRHQGRTVPELPARAHALSALLPRLDALAAPGDRVFVFDSDLVRPMITDVGLYYLLPRLRGRAKNLEITPGVSSTSGSGLAHDVASADVVVLVTAPEPFRQALFPYARDGSHAAADVLARHFCRVATVDFYEVYQRCAR